MDGTQNLKYYVLIKIFYSLFKTASLRRSGKCITQWTPSSFQQIQSHRIFPRERQRLKGIVSASYCK